MMKCVPGLLACVLWAVPVLAQGTAASRDPIGDLRSRNQEASRLLSQKKTKEALLLYRELVADPALLTYGTMRPAVLYNLACCHSLLGEKERALSALGEAVEAGYVNVEHLEKDTDLEGIRTEKGYRDIVATMNAGRSLWSMSAFKTAFRDNISEEEKIAGLSLIWSEVRYNFANFAGVPGLNWDSLYIEYLPKVRATASTLEYYQVLQELTAKLRDGHTNVYLLPKEIQHLRFGLPLRAALVEGRVVVTAVESDSLRGSGIIPGLEVTRIQGVPVRLYASERIAPSQNASTDQDLTERTYGALFRSPFPGTVPVEFADGEGRIFERVLQRVPFRFPRPPAVECRILREHVAYVALNTFSEESVLRTFDSLFARIMENDALIIDVRNNSGGSSTVGWDILAYLTDTPFVTTRWKTREHRGVYSAWGLGERWYGEPGSLWKTRAGEPYRKPVVVLTSARTYSAAEDFCVAFDAMKRGMIIGEPTGGSTGQPIMLPLPGGGGVRICAKHDEYPDGREFIGVGVQPGLVVKPAIADLREGKDRVLETALDYLARSGARPR